MIEVGILQEDDPVELLDGKIVDMSPKGSKHAACLRKMMSWMPAIVGEKAQIQAQDPISIPDHSEPEPDLALVAPRADFYAARHPLPQEVYLIIEIADSSLEIDRTIKAALYAQAGIQNYWLINLVDNQVEVFTNPEGGRYHRLATYRKEDSLIIPEVEVDIEVGDMLIPV